MNGRNAREIRKQARGEVARVVPVLEAAMNNEGITRTRVQALEQALAAHAEALQAQDRFRGRTFLGRMTWLFLGR